ncbi:MAG: hypothetical protein HQL87_07930 [Magnetococcales bacterium]|nr:hypothetical protein [Magnetococcales bacterium]
MANITVTGSNPQGISNAAMLDTTAPSLRESQNRLSGGFKMGLTIHGAQSRGEASLLVLGDRSSTDLQTLSQVTMNVQDGLAMTQVAQAGLGDVQTDLQQMQALLDSSRSDSLSEGDRAALQTQAEQTQDAIRQKVQDTRYLGIPLLATTRTVVLQTGMDTNAQTTINLKDLSSAFTPVDLTSPAGVDAATLSLQKEGQMVGQAQAQLGAQQSALTAAMGSLQAYDLAPQSLFSTGTLGRVDSSDAAQTSANQMATLIRENAGMAFQVQANQSSVRVQQLL